VAFLKKTLRIGALLLVVLLLIQTLSGFTVPEGKDRHQMPWDFVVHAAPDFRSEIMGSFNAQTIEVTYRNGTGWARMRNHDGNNWWVYLRDNRRFLPSGTLLHDARDGAPVAAIAPQMARVLQQEGNWLRVGTWLGENWVQWRPEPPRPIQHHMAWSFLTYLTPDFRAPRQETLPPQIVEITQLRDDGWGLISTPAGDRWIYVRDNMRYVDREVALYDKPGGTERGRLQPQVVHVLQQDRSWFQIATWDGPRWIYLRSAGQPGERLIAITFDDGPHPAHTRRLLDALYERDVPATFFVLGPLVASNPELAIRMVNEGHEIASHAYNHTDLSRAGADRIRTELTMSRDIIRKVTGVTPTLLRPPYGAQNSTVQAISAEFGWPIILWSVDTRDWETRNVNAIMRHFVDHTGIRIRTGDIILMHDIYPTTIDAAIQAIDLLLADGFTFVTVTDLLMERYGTIEPGRVYRQG